MRMAGARCISKTCRCILSIMYGRCLVYSGVFDSKRSLRQTIVGMRRKSARWWCRPLHSFALESLLFQIIITYWTEHAVAWCWQLAACAAPNNCTSRNVISNCRVPTAMKFRNHSLSCCQCDAVNLPNLESIEIVKYAQNVKENLQFCTKSSLKLCIIWH